MFTKNYYKNSIISSKFKAPRFKADGKTIDFYHSGIDIVDTKLAPIYSILDGTLFHAEKDHKMYGNFVIIKHNLSYLNPPTPIIIYSLYAHLHTINVSKTETFIKSGTVIGSMGNTGNCWTLDKGSWRPITLQEKNDPNCQ
jgi:murein DD-endopeptidase MepM/ murein hydrolase activator NlpD